MQKTKSSLYCSTTETNRANPHNNELKPGNLVLNHCQLNNNSGWIFPLRASFLFTPWVCFRNWSVLSVHSIGFYWMCCTENKRRNKHRRTKEKMCFLGCFQSGLLSVTYLLSWLVLCFFKMFFSQHESLLIIGMNEDETMKNNYSQ